MMQWTLGTDRSLLLRGAVDRGVFYAVGMFEADAWAIEMSSGRVLWRRETAPDAAWLPPAPGSRMIYVPSRYSARPPFNVYALSKAVGKERWRRTFPGERIGGMAASDGKAYVAARAGPLVCLREADGRTVWSVASIRCQSAPAVAGSRVLVLGSDQLYCIAAEDGSVLWHRPLRGARIMAGDAASHFGMAYVQGGRLRTLYAIRVSDGSVQWTWQLPKGASAGWPPVHYLPMADGVLCAYSIAGRTAATALVLIPPHRGASTQMGRFPGEVSPELAARGRRVFMVLDRKRVIAADVEVAGN